MAKITGVPAEFQKLKPYVPDATEISDRIYGGIYTPTDLIEIKKYFKQLEERESGLTARDKLFFSRLYELVDGMWGMVDLSNEYSAFNSLNIFQRCGSSSLKAVLPGCPP